MSWFLVLKSLLAICIISHLSVRSVETYGCIQKTCTNGRCDPIPNTCESSKGCFFQRQDLEFLRLYTVEQQGCSEDKCTELAFSATLGRSQMFRYERRCCYTQRCNREKIKVPPPSSEINGVECPACYSEHGTCSPVFIRCTGEEKMCVTVTGKGMKGNKYFFTEIYAMGCATRTACNLMNITVMDNNKINTSCVSGSPPLRPILSVLSSLFLMKALL